MLSTCQYGFLGSKSTSNMVNDFTNYIVDNLNGKHIVLAIFLDLTNKVLLVTVSITLLNNNMEQLAIRNIQLKHFQDYLSYSFQCTKNWELPKWVSATESIYTNGLSELQLKNGRILAYDDNIALLCHGKFWTEVYSYVYVHYKYCRKKTM